MLTLGLVSHSEVTVLFSVVVSDMDTEETFSILVLSCN